MVTQHRVNPLATPQLAQSLCQGVDGAGIFGDKIAGEDHEVRVEGIALGDRGL
jgi:hypothetical protein